MNEHMIMEIVNQLATAASTIAFIFQLPKLAQILANALLDARRVPAKEKSQIKHQRRR